MQAGAEQHGKDLVAHQAQNSARHHCQADDAGVARDAGAAVLRSIRVHILRVISYSVARNVSAVDAPAQSTAS